MRPGVAVAAQGALLLTLYCGLAWAPEMLLLRCAVRRSPALQCVF